MLQYICWQHWNVDKKSIKYFEQHPVGLQSPILAWQTRYNFNSVPMATTVLCLIINPRNLKKIIGRSHIPLHMTRKGNLTDLHTQLCWLSLPLQCFLSLDVLLFSTAEVLPRSSLQLAPREQQCLWLLLFYPAQSEIQPALNWGNNQAAWYSHE